VSASPVDAAIAAAQRYVFGLVETACGLSGISAYIEEVRFVPTSNGGVFPWPRPREGVELGGQPRNPEDDVVDAIDELVSWQMENGKQW
jgi:hypothetical protein